VLAMLLICRYRQLAGTPDRQQAGSYRVHFLI